MFEVNSSERLDLAKKACGIRVVFWGEELPDRIATKGLPWRHNHVVERMKANTGIYRIVDSFGTISRLIAKRPPPSSGFLGTAQVTACWP
jgi:hypothetical protein